MKNKPYWLIGFYRNNVWESFVLPEEVCEETVEQVLLNLNQVYRVSVLRNIKGIWEKEATLYSINDFIGF